MNLEVDDETTRTGAYRALSDRVRLRIVESLWFCDRTPSELRSLVGVDWNLLGFHLNVLEQAGLIDRTRSEGDGRRRYVALRPDLPIPLGPPRRSLEPLRPRALFVCTHNAARSQFAAALWRKSTGLRAASAGSNPAAAVHPLAVEVAAEQGLDLSRARPRGFSAVRRADVVVSVCDRAKEGALPQAPTMFHWSIPDPLGGAHDDFEHAFAEITSRMSRLVALAGRAGAKERL